MTRADQANSTIPNETIRRGSKVVWEPHVKTENYYDAISHQYDRLRFGKPYGRWVSQFELSLVRERIRGPRILELGPGTGRVTSVLIECGEQVVALEQAGKMVEQLCARVSSPKLLVINRDLFEMEQVNGYGKFDSVVALHVLPHVEDILKALRLMRDSVHVGGQLVFDLWDRHSSLLIARKLFGEPQDVYTQYLSRLEMRRAIEMSGLKIVRVDYWGLPHIGHLNFESLCRTPLRLFAYCNIFECVRCD